MTNRYVAEIIGTFALVFAGTGAIVVNKISGGVATHPGIALTFGLVVMAVIHAVGRFFGAYLNAAVTVGFFLARRFQGRCVLPHVTSQLTGAIIASLVVRYLFGTADHPRDRLELGRNLFPLIDGNSDAAQPVIAADVGADRVRGSAIPPPGRFHQIGGKKWRIDLLVAQETASLRADLGAVMSALTVG